MFTSGQLAEIAGVPSLCIRQWRFRGYLKKRKGTYSLEDAARSMVLAEFYKMGVSVSEKVSSVASKTSNDIICWYHHSEGLARPDSRIFAVGAISIDLAHLGEKLYRNHKNGHITK